MKPNGAKRKEASQCGARSQTADLAVNQFSGMYVKFRDSEVTVAGKKSITVRIWSELNMLINHGFAEIYLLMSESDKSPAVDFYDVKLSAVFILWNIVVIGTRT